MATQLIAGSTALQVESLPQVGRRLRRPSSGINIRFHPWQLQPCYIHPVLPGDTMKNLLLQAKVYTDPITAPHVGWWFETYFFYVKLRDLDDRDSLVQMLMTNAGGPAAEAADARYFYNGQGINFAKKCLTSVVKNYFRDEEEVAANAAPLMVGMPQCKLNISNFMENLKLGSDAPISDGTPVPGDHWPELPEHLAAFAPAYQQWKEMQAVQMVPPTFEDYIKTFGVKLPKAIREETHKPELLRYIRDWKMPSNTIDPATGTPSSAIVWDVAERADKDRFFAEPGFVFGVMTARPKIYSANQNATVTAFLNDAYAWLPALLSADPFTSLRKFTGAVSPITGMAEDHWLDLADLFMNGEDFRNDTLANLKAPAASVPILADDEMDGAAGDLKLNTTFAKDQDMVALFKDTTYPPTAGTKQFIHVDGRCDLTLLSRVQDTTP